MLLTNLMALSWFGQGQTVGEFHVSHLLHHLARTSHQMSVLGQQQLVGRKSNIMREKLRIKEGSNVFRLELLLKIVHSLPSKNYNDQRKQDMLNQIIAIKKNNTEKVKVATSHLQHLVQSKQITSHNIKV